MMQTKVSKNYSTSYFLNYIAFFLLYVVSLVSVNYRGVEIVSFLFLFIIHAAFSIYFVSEINVLLLSFGESFVLQLSLLAVGITLILHFVSLIFIIMMVYAQEKKFVGMKGTPLYLPEKYANKLSIFKQQMIGCFCLCIIILFIIFQKNNDITKFNIRTAFNLMNYDPREDIIAKLYYILATIISPILISLSIYQIIIANDFTDLARKKLQN
jgi:hypothetical protein